MRPWRGYWEAIGIEVQRQVVEFNPTFLALIRSRDTNAYAYVNSVPFQDERLRNLSGTDPRRKGSCLAFLYDPTIDEYNDKAPKEVDLEKRMALARRLGDGFVEQRLQIPLLTSSALWRTSMRIRSWDPIQGYGQLHNVETIVLAR